MPWRGGTVDKWMVIIKLHLVMHAASAIDGGRKDEEGRSAHRRWKGRECAKPVNEFRECVLYAPSMSAGKDKRA